MVCVKLNSAGVFQWIDRHTSSGNADDELFDLVLDAPGNIYATGFETNSATGKNFWTAKYSSAGTIVWSATYNGPYNDIDEAYSITLDRTGNVIITGKSDGGASAFDMATVKYNSSGVQQWASRFNGSANTTDEGKSVTVDTTGNIYITGYSTNPTTAQDFQTVKYNSAGFQQWEIKYTNSSAAGSSEISNSIHVDNAGNVYVAGTSSLDYAVVKYSTVSGISSLSNQIPSGFELRQNYPNPFNPSTNIEFKVVTNEHVSLDVYDINGKLVEELVNSTMSAGAYMINFDASKLSSGIYFYKLTTSSFSDTKRMMLVK
jgi:hypothetical protein